MIARGLALFLWAHALLWTSVVADSSREPSWGRFAFAPAMLVTVAVAAGYLWRCGRAGDDDGR